MIPSWQAIEIATILGEDVDLVQKMIQLAARRYPGSAQEAEDAVVRALAGGIPLHAILYEEVDDE